jgi:RNA polymerase sigma factor (sigma-70 family)
MHLAAYPNPTSPTDSAEEADEQGRNYSATEKELRELAAGSLDDAGRLALRDVLQKALSRLSLDEARIVRWRHLLGCSFEEIASSLNKPPGAIKTADCRALKKLRQFLLAKRVQPPTSPRVRKQD